MSDHVTKSAREYMTVKDLFVLLDAPLADPRWSSGAVRPSDGSIFLRVWQDRMKRHEGRNFVQITHKQTSQNDTKNIGNDERLKHVEQIRNGASCYMIMCQAADVEAPTWKVKSFNAENV